MVVEKVVEKIVVVEELVLDLTATSDASHNDDDSEQVDEVQAIGII